MKIADLVKQNVPPKILIYGSAGAGKTALVSQAKNGYLMDFDNGLRTCITLKDNLTELRQQIEFDSFKDENPAKPNKWILAKQKILDISAQIAAKKWKYDCLIIDSLTGVGQMVQNQVMANAGKPMEKPDIGHWGIMVSELENILTIITSLNTLVIITGHEVPILTQKGGLGHPEEDVYELRVLCIGNKLPGKLPWMFDEFLHASAKTVGGKSKYFLSGKKTSYVQARTRSSFKEVNHTEIGLAGVLEELQYSLSTPAKNNAESLLK